MNQSPKVIVFKNSTVVKAKIDHRTIPENEKKAARPEYNDVSSLDLCRIVIDIFKTAAASHTQLSKSKTSRVMLPKNILLQSEHV